MENNNHKIYGKTGLFFIVKLQKFATEIHHKIQSFWCGKTMEQNVFWMEIMWRSENVCFFVSSSISSVWLFLFLFFIIIISSSASYFYLNIHLMGISYIVFPQPMTQTLQKQKSGKQELFIIYLFFHWEKMITLNI